MPEQQFIKTKDCKHSVVYGPVNEKDPSNICTGIYVSRKVLPNPVPEVIRLSVEFGPAQAPKAS